MLMALQAGAKLTEDTQVRFAVLMHDLGKGTTPEEEWPKHRAHEARGVKLVKALCKRIKAPRRYTELACAVCANQSVAVAGQKFNVDFFE